MKVIELRRHSIKSAPGDHSLSPEGVLLAEKIGAEQLRGKHFTKLFISTLERTSATLAAFARGAGDFPNMQPEIFPLHTRIFATPEGMPLWEGACNRAERAGKDMLTAALTDDFVVAESIAKKSAEAFRSWISELPEESHALVVGQSCARIDRLWPF